MLNLVEDRPNTPMKKYSGNILIVEDDEDVALTSRMILKQYFDNIECLP